MITNQISDWYASPQTVTVDDMTNFSQDLYQRIAQIGYNKIPCIINLKGNLIYNSNNLTNIILPEGCFIFKETNYNFLTYQTFPIGIAQSTTLDLNSINDGYIVARYSIDPTLPNQTSYKINTSYVVTTNINIVTDVLICTIKNGSLIENGVFLFEPKQYIISNLTKFYTLNINYANTFPRSSSLLTNDNNRFYINDVEVISNVPHQKIFSFYDPISGIANENNFGNYFTDSAPIDMSFGLVNSVSDASNNTITIKYFSNAGLVINNALFDYIKYKKINKNFYFIGKDNVSNKGLLIYGNDINPQYKFYDFCQIIYDVIFYNNKWYLSTDTGIYSGTDIENVSIINGITIGSYYFKSYNYNGNNILLLINSEYCEFVGNGLTDYYYLSNNGTTFTQYKLPSSSPSGFNDLIANIECNEKVFIAIGQQNITLGQSSVYISYDAINWDSISTIGNPNNFTSLGNNAYKLKYINNKFILLLLTCNTGASPNFIRLYCSDDGITWFQGNTIRATDLIDRGVADQNIIRRYSLHNDLFYFKGYYIFYGKKCLYSFTLNERG